MQLRVMGPVEVVDGGRTIPLGPKERVLLVALEIRAGRVVRASELVEALWPQQAPVKATKVLQNHVLRLRKALAAGGGSGISIESHHGGYVLRLGPDALDAAAAVAALELARAAARQSDYSTAADLLGEISLWWRGRCFGDIGDEPFAMAEAARLEELRLTVIEERIEAELALGRAGELAPELDALTTGNPLRERLWCQLIVALYRAGRQADALRAYQRARSILLEELGLEPGPELRRLEQAVLVQDPALMESERPVGIVSPRSPVPAVPSALTGTGPAFVGRLEELDRLRHAWKESVGLGGRRAVLIGGEPGVGKTRLIAELSGTAAEEGGTVLYGRCDEELVLPYQPFVEALRSWLTQVPLHALSSFDGRALAEVARLVPELAERRPGLLPTAPAPPDVERESLFDAVAAMLAKASESAPVLLVVDDLQWAASPALELLRSLLSSPRPMALLVVGAYRDTELGHSVGLSKLLADLRRHECVERLDLVGLDEPALDAFVSMFLDDEIADRSLPLARALAARTAGNPFLVGELMRHIVEARGDGLIETRELADVLNRLEVPDSVQEVIGRRLGRLTSTSRAVIAIAAAAGRTTTVPVLAQASGLDQGALDDAVDECVRAGVLVELRGSPGGLGFTHDLLRQAVYDRLTALAVERVENPRILCAASEQYAQPSLGFNLDVDVLETTFGTQRVIVERALTRKRLTELLTSGRFDIVHLVVAVEEATGDLIFSPIDFDTLKPTTTMVDKMSAASFAALLVESQTRLVVLATCHALLLAVEVAHVANMAASDVEINGETAAEWAGCFYGLLRKGRSVFKAFDITRSQIDAPIRAIRQRDVVFIFSKA